MLSLDHIRKKIKSIETTSKITNAMYLVATANLRKCNKQFTESQIFFNEFYQIVGDLIEEKKQIGAELFNKNGPVYYIMIGSDIGLCGPYNVNVFNLLSKKIKPNDRICLIGKKSLFLFKSIGLDKNIDEVISFPPGLLNIYFTEYITTLIFKKNVKNYSKIVLVYTKYRNPLIFEPVTLQILPIDPKFFVKQRNDNEVIDYEPSKKDILKDIIRMVFSVFLYGALAESRLCENSSRRNSMHVATKNAENLIKKYKLVYNKIRQSNITQEIIEIVSGSNLNERSN